MASIGSMADVLSSLFTTTYCTNTALTILFYDWLLCLDQEIACVWKAGDIFNAGSLVYALSRFPLMLGMIFTTATIFPLSAPR
ncbi:hypothetical protein GSI_04974 [Ganoderma sinense ZZ0214-1]|uniref:DUF6533 domain-containing protein n=1 Tax=Ganoderma sinense ZZ0214-1 TaxID=1077348 RepID=A0A2G8SGM9_9APHY|nr:hypothetical protein GSI_04974 [Ganoderma sinense ZZ0214-1]